MSGSIVLTLKGRNRVARGSERLHNLLDLHVVVIEGDGQGVSPHVGRHRVHLIHFLDGPTGPRCGTASDDPGRFEHIGHSFRR